MATFRITGITDQSPEAAGDPLKIGDVLAFTLATDQSVDDVTLGTGGMAPTLMLSNGGTATITGFDTVGLHFAYKVQAAQYTADLNVISLQLNGASITHARAGFAPKSDTAVGGGPLSIVTGDVNGDGKLDLVATNHIDNTVSVLLGNGNGTFQAQTTQAVGAQPFSTIAADVNGDGKLDLVVANGNGNTVSVLAGNGNGTFQNQTTQNVGSQPVSVVAADVNGDGKLDIVTANASSSNVSVLLGNGDGTFRAQTTSVVGSIPNFVVAADLNGDGKLDLITTNYNG